MSIRSIFRQRFALGLLVTMVAMSGLYGEELVFKDQNVAVTPPEAWVRTPNLPPNSGLVARFANPDESRVLLLIVANNNNPALVMDDKFITGYLQGRQESSGIKSTRGKFIQVSGAKTYEDVGTLTANGANAATLSRTILTDGKLGLRSSRFMWAPIRIRIRFFANRWIAFDCSARQRRKNLRPRRYLRPRKLL